MIINGFIWDDLNIQHISWHNVSPDEVNETLLNKLVITKEYKERYGLYGVTITKRMLIVIIEGRDNDYYYPITAFNMNTRQKEFYNKEVKNI